MYRAKAERILNKIVLEIEDAIDYFCATGSYRRGAEKLGDLDIVIIPRKGKKLDECLPLSFEGINWLGEKKAQLIIDGEKVDIHCTNWDSLGAAQLYFTGPKGYNIGMRIRAKKMGYKLNEYGLWKGSEMMLSGSENIIYEHLEKSWKEPNKRG